METDKSHNNTYCYRYPHPAVTADCVIFGFDGTSLKILLVERGLEPYKGMWALPGGFMNINETIEQTAERELREETGVKDVFLTQFKVYSGVDRDPRERVITVAFIALVRHKDYASVKGGDDARLAAWFDIDFLPPMAFDHAMIVTEAREYLTEMLRQRPVAFTLLDDTFSMTELQNVYEAIIGETFDRRNFQRKVVQADIVKPLGTSRRNEASRPAKLYAVNQRLRPDIADDSNWHDLNCCMTENANEEFEKPSKPDKEKTSRFSLKNLFNF